jgi:Ca2+/Na+ antiporter
MIACDDGDILCLFVALVLVLIAMVLIMFNCDAFEPASEYLGVEVYHLKPGIRGASIEAVASSLPELFTTLFLLFVFHDEDGFAAGIATCAGSAIFNGAVIPALCILMVTTKGVNGEVVETIKLRRATLVRDGVFFLGAEVLLIALLNDSKMSWWMGLLLMLVYVVYAVVLVLAIGMGEDEDGEEGGEESTSTASGEDAEAPGDVAGDDDDLELAERTQGGGGSTGEDDDRDRAFSNPMRDEEGQVDQPGDGEEDEDPSFVMSLVTFDWNGVLFGGAEFTPTSAWVVLIMATLWIAAACYILAEAVIISAKALGVAPYFTAVILGAAASSVPDTIISAKNAMKGDYDDAVANAIGSNIFDICFALGFPLFLYGLIYGDVDMATTDDGSLASGNSHEGAQEAAQIQSLRILLVCASVVMMALFLFTKTSTDEAGRPMHHVGLPQAIGLILIYLSWTVVIVLQAAEVIEF